MDFKKLTTKYKQFGGIRLVLEYAKLGVLPTIITSFFRCLVKRQSFKAIYPEVLSKIEPFLVKRYAPVLRSKKSDVRSKLLAHEHPKVIWWCWLQGIENAPSIVKACFNSLMREFKGSRVQEVQGLNDGYEIKVIDAENWKEYIELPDYIVKKWDKGRIPAASFSDLLRLQLLIKYGGTWIDSTVLCTGFKEFNGLSSSSDSTSLPSVQEFKKYLEADLFLFQYTKPGKPWSGNVSTWFISAYSNNEVLITVRDMLFAYWKDYDCLLDYYAIHLFFSVVSKAYPEQIAAMPYGYSVNSLTLLHQWGKKFNQEWWNKLTSQVCFHKLAFRVSQSVIDNKNDYYNWIISNYSK